MQPEKKKVRTLHPGNAEPLLGNKREWYSRGYLPHRDNIALLQAVTFRLADSLPQNILKQLEVELSFLEENRRDTEKRKKIEYWLDSGYGSCALNHAEVANVMQDTLLKFDNEKYKLIAWVIMPNHIHVLLEPHIPLARIVQSWKSFTGKWALAHNAELDLGIRGEKFWMREYWDRFIRDDNHLHNTIQYIDNNPVKAGLCTYPEEWNWSSAGVR